MQKTPYIKTSNYEGRKGDVKKVVLLYSGGLDTSVMLKWIKDEYKAEVVALTIDIGQQADDLNAIKEKALKLGAIKALVIDAKDEFAEEYIARGIKANASYQGSYHLSTPLGRPLLAKLAVEVAEAEDADCIAHGCTGKGNDQVRLEGTILTLNPEMKIIAPVREWSMGRDEELIYAKKHGIPVKQTSNCPYSWDDNMWGVTGESGEIEDPKLVPPLDKILQVCKPVEQALDKPETIELEFVKGLPIAVNGKQMKLTTLIAELNQIGARHGVGVTVHIEDRIVGLKVRGVYEAPAAEIIIQAHQNLEKFVSTRIENEFKTLVDQKFAYLCYGALWYEPTMKHLQAYLDSVNEKVNGKVTVKLYKGRADVMAMETPQSLFDEKMATFMKSEAFNQNAAPGFIELWTLQMKMAKQAIPQVLLSLRDEDKPKLLPSIKKLYKANNTHFFATKNTHDFLKKNGVESQFVYKVSEDGQPNIHTLLQQRRFDLIINTPTPGKKNTTLHDAEVIKQFAMDKGIKLITEIDVAEGILEKMASVKRRS